VSFVLHKLVHGGFFLMRGERVDVEDEAGMMVFIASKYERYQDLMMGKIKEEVKEKVGVKCEYR